MFLYSDDMPIDTSVELPESVSVFDPNYVHTERIPLYQTKANVDRDEFKERVSENKKAVSGRDILLNLGKVNNY